MKLKHTDDTEYKSSSTKLLLLTWICVIVVLLSDTVTVFIDARFLGNTVFSTAFKTYILAPGLINILIMAVVHILSYFLIRKKRFGAQACVYITGVTLICFVLARSNADMSIAMIFFIIPIVLSLFYLDKKLLVYSLCVSMITFAIHSILIINEKASISNHAMLPINVEVVLVLTVIIFIAGMLIISRSDSLLKKLEESTTKKNEDSLTGYLNHSGFYEDLDVTFKNAVTDESEFSLAIIDIDNFSVINEEYGHEFGDEVIGVMVDSINRSLVNTAKAYRYGGEEFAMICNGHEEIMINMVDSILRDFRNKTEMKLDVVVTASAGICGYVPKLFKGKRDIFAALDEALYAAKRRGKNQFVVWNETVTIDSYAESANI